MGHMRLRDIQPYEKHFWTKNRIDLLRGSVISIDFDRRVLHFDPYFAPVDSELPEHPPKIGYDRLILALGSTPNKFGWPGQDLKKVQGFYSFQDLEQIETHSAGLDRAVIVGGGLIGIELAEMFHSRNIPVTMLVREKNYWDVVLPPEESQMINRQIRLNHIDLRLETELKEIVGDHNGEAIGVITNQGDKINCGFVGLTAGVHPNVAWLKDSHLEIDRGILVDECLQTNIEGVYAIGDCAQLRSPQPGRRNIEAVWYTGRMMGEVCAHNITGNKTAYDPGLWYNSAKFFDIEYQVYGQVPSLLPEDWRSFFWQHPNREKSLRIVYDASKTVKGFNLMGMRFRHEVCEKWIIEKTKIHSVVKDLSLANFDPEFYTDDYEQIVSAFNKDLNENITPGQKRNYNAVYSFLKKAT